MCFMHVVLMCGVMGCFVLLIIWSKISVFFKKKIKLEKRRCKYVIFCPKRAITRYISKKNVCKITRFSRFLPEKITRFLKITRGWLSSTNITARSPSNLDSTTLGYLTNKNRKALTSEPTVHHHLINSSFDTSSMFWNNLLFLDFERILENEQESKNINYQPHWKDPIIYI